MAMGDWKKKNDFVLGKKRSIRNMRKGADKEITNTDEYVVAQEVRELLDRIEPMISQINNLYNQYVHGVTKQPPNQQRTILHALIARVTKMPKPTQALKYRYETIYNRYTTFRDRWEKMMKDLEAGRIGNRRQKKYHT